MRGFLVFIIVLMNLACDKKGYLETSGPTGTAVLATTSGSDPELPSATLPAAPLTFSQPSVTGYANFDVITLPQYILNGVPPYLYTVLSTEATAYVIEGDQFFSLDPATTVIKIQDAEGKEGNFTVVTLPEI